MLRSPTRPQPSGPCPSARSLGSCLSLTAFAPPTPTSHEAPLSLCSCEWGHSGAAPGKKSLEEGKEEEQDSLLAVQLRKAQGSCAPVLLCQAPGCGNQAEEERPVAPWMLPPPRAPFESLPLDFLTLLNFLLCRGPCTVQEGRLIG